MADMLGKYELRGVLGKGAMGTVYEGFDPIIARRVAIKTIKLPEPDDAEAQDELARFKREAQAAGRLSHPNIVGVFDYGEAPELAYIVMELVDGTTLKHVVDKKERFELAEVARLMEALLTGLQFSHDRGVVHRDIKPANIMLTKTGEVKISDFGIARIESSSMTQAGTVLGTPAYMSPEQFMGQTVDSRTDIYSAGVLLYQLLTGEKPFEGGLTAIMHKVLNTEPPPPSALSVTVPHAFDAVVKQAMAKRPEDRFATATDFAAALRAAMVAKVPAPASDFSIGDFGDGDATMVATAKPVVTAVKPPPPATAASLPAAEKKSGPPVALLAVAAVVVLAIIGGGAYFLFGGQKPAPVAQTAPAKPAAPAPAPTPAPTPVTPPVQTAAQRLAVLNTALGNLPCTLLTTADGSPPVLTGIAGAGAPQAALTGALAKLANATPAIAVASQVQTIDGPYCGALDTVRPYRPLLSAAALNLGLAGGKTTLANGALIALNATLPGYAGAVEIDYFQSDGTVFHLVPKLAAGQLALSQNVGEVSAPFGTDLIVAIASSLPLFSPARPQLENDSAYLPALQLALQGATAAGGQVSVAALPVVTVAGAGPP
jgi:serine/threonine-protein kinase